MRDLDDQLHELFQRRADDVSPHREVPRSLARRARHRIALTALGAGIGVIVVAAGALAGIRALGDGPAVDQLGGGRSTSSAQPSAPVTPECTAAQLRAVGSMEGAAGSREGSIGLTNLSDTTCTLEGTPAITLLDDGLTPITSDVTFVSSPAGWVADGSPQPPGWPVVTIAPGDPASVRVRWSNWCPDGRVAPLWRIDIPGGGTVDVSNGMDSVPPPPCNGPDEPSTIEVGPFEPGAGS
jgi:hypothetical protein